MADAKLEIVKKYQARMKELVQQKEETLKALAPFREFYEQHVNDPKYLAAKKALKESGAILGPIDQELAMIARALGAKRIKIEPGVFSSKAGE